MKISVNLMKDYSDASQWQISVKDMAKKIGRQLGEVEGYIDFNGKYDGVIVAQIISAREHPGADKLGIYQIDAGQIQTQVVAGDKTLKVGDKVAWISPGSIVPVTWGTDSPFEIGARQMRGEDSNGMFGSGKELDINDNHERVQVLDTDAPAGMPFAEAYNLVGDAIIDIENKMFTHRPDCFGNLGVAREIAGIQNLPFTSPDWYSLDVEMPQPEGEQLPLSVKNHIPKLVPRYMAVVLDDVKISPSPLSLQMTLRKLGIKPINNVVDITNFIMALTAQPLHAFDYDKLEGAKIEVRHPSYGESLPLLDGRTITPPEKSMLICDAHKPIALGGMMGGANSEIDIKTKRVVLECANFDMYTIRRTSMLAGVFTDAVTRYSKGQSILQCTPIMAQAIVLLQKFAGARVASPVIDDYAEPVQIQPINTSASFINERLGGSFEPDYIATLLRNVECDVEQHGDQLIITPPFWRTDLEIPEDIVEEIGRLNGFDNLPHSLPRRSTQAAPLSEIDDLKHQIRGLMAQAGANELQTYSFVPQRLLQQVGQDKKRAYAIRNAISPELEHYRLSILPSLLEKVHPNVKAGYKEFGLFEINKSHLKSDESSQDLPHENQTIAFVFASNNKLPGAAYYQAKYFLDYLLAELGLQYKLELAENTPTSEFGRQVFAPFEPKRSAHVKVGDNEFAGCVGEFRATVSKNLKLPKICAGFEIDVEKILQHKRSKKYQSLLRFPETSQDICLKVKNDLEFSSLLQMVRQSLEGDERLRIDLAPVDIYQKSGDESHKQITVKVTLQHHDRTLTTAEVNDMLDNLVNDISVKTWIERV